MVLHKSFIVEILFLGTYIFFVSIFLNYNSRSSGNIAKRIAYFCVITIAVLFLANRQRLHVANGSASLFQRYRVNANGDMFILLSKHSLFECKHWDAVSHNFKKIFNLKTPGFSLGRQLYVDIYGYKRAEKDKFPTWWPTPVSGFIYLCGYSGILIGSFFMATVLFFLEYISRKNDTLFFSCIGFLVLKIYSGWIFNWFLISGLIPLCLIYTACRKI